MTHTPRAHRRRAHTLRACALLLAVLLTGCTLGNQENIPGGGIVNIETMPLIAQADRDPAPDVCSETVTEEQLCLEEFAGKPVLVNFWASWCGPCAREIPELVGLGDLYADQIQIIGVNNQDTRTNARSFERDQDVDYPSWFDRGAVIAAEFRDTAPIGLPSTILLDREHRVALRVLGGVSADQLVPYIDQLTTE
ncbi:TlpA family protein disulfide reductase [Euzebya tangerina]|uniref:TlpA family protein disulfide reductase n=1 Tax=Euzebya tangerina TaxID=591198 RepID=UPI000E3151D8|nr:TlpA disulfide reductase family protein [Euzebya tangerina]